MPLLEVRHVSKKFGGTQALDGVSLSVSKGEIVGIIGPNGAGKTTLFNIIAGSLHPDSGVILFENKPINGLPSFSRCKLGIARTYQIPKPLPSLNLLGNVMVGCLFGRRNNISVADAKSEAEDILHFIGLYEKRKEAIDHLNVNELRLLELARALATKPKLLLLDETLAGLNPHEVNRMLDVIKHIRAMQNVTIVMIEHVMRAIMSISDRVIVLHQGKKIAEGPPSSIAVETTVIEAYLGEHIYSVY
jgi:branched-chain amino acid transport system ATP-binding protein